MAPRMTDEQWEAQNGRLSPGEATARGLCWCCSGNGFLFSAFGGKQIKTRCPERCDHGKAKR
ncbi:hypothetical protein ACIG0D_27310 [Streptomyces sp. NPDC052773]|uniref:hypothetical protein n=1 Tax=Streptomyces sp. NPDC052773 TaxID=3365693 RepID=UPI0037D1D18A